MSIKNIFYVRLSSNDNIAMKNVERTINEGVLLEEVYFHLSEQHKELLSKYNLKRIFAWGSLPTEGNLKLWQQMNEGDYFLVLIDDILSYVSKVILKIRSKDIARIFWGEHKSGETWELIYLLLPPIKIYVYENDIKKYTEDIVSFSPRGFNKFSDDRIKRLKSRYSSIQNFILHLVNISLREEVLELKPYVSKEEEKEAIAEPKHDNLKNIIAELGTLLDKISEKEVNIKVGRIDVVWKKTEKSIPYLAFEVHIKGDIYADLSKLKYASELWNSTPVLITDDKGFSEAQKLLDGPFNELKGKIRIIHWKDIIEIYSLVKELKDKHKKIGGIFFSKFR